MPSFSFQSKEDLHSFCDFILEFSVTLAKQITKEYDLDSTSVNLMLNTIFKKLLPEFDLQLYSKEDNPMGVDVDTDIVN